MRLILPLLLCVAPIAHAAEVAITVENIRSVRGQLVLSVVGTHDKRIVRREVAAVVGEVTVAFADLAPGDYAIKIFHDEDGDGLLGKNFLGLPAGGYAFSSRARARFGPPKFAAMRFHVVDGAAAATRARMVH